MDITCGHHAHQPLLSWVPIKIHNQVELEKKAAQWNQVNQVPDHKDSASVLNLAGVIELLPKTAVQERRGPDPIQVAQHLVDHAVRDARGVSWTISGAVGLSQTGGAQHKPSGTWDDPNMGRPAHCFNARQACGLGQNGKPI